MTNLSGSEAALDPPEIFKMYVLGPFRAFKADSKIRPQAAPSSYSSSGCQQSPMNLTKPQAALAEALRAKDEAVQAKDAAIQDRDQLKSRLNAITMTTSAPEKPTCQFLKRIPREIRNMIYSYLLINSELSHTKCLYPNHLPNSSQQNYGLSPAILRANQQIYEEASTILYGSNTFIIDCGQRQWFRSALVRVFDAEPSYKPLFTTECHLPPTVDTVPAIKKVKHWKVFLSAAKSSDSPPSEALFNFCQAISDAPVEALKVYLIPKEVDSHSSSGWNSASTQYYGIEWVLRPLQMLRNIPYFELLDAEGVDLGIYRPDPDMWSIKPHNIDPEWKCELVSMVKGNTPVKMLFKMNKRLQAYAQAFERNMRWKSEMVPKYGEYRRQIPSTGLLSEHVQGYFDDDFLQQEKDRNGWGIQGRWNTETSPFKLDSTHPIESGLAIASLGCETHKYELFAMARALVVESLEYQYQRITAAHKTITEYIKQNKHFKQLFGADSWHDKISCSEALLHLEEYASTFKRCQTLGMQILIRMNPRKFDIAYAGLPRERLMKDLGDLLETSFCDNDEFPKMFKQAVDDMDSQYFEIRRARKALFDFDTEDPKCHIKLDDLQCEDMIDWTVNEPVMFPTRLPSKTELDMMEQEGRELEVEEPGINGSEGNWAGLASNSGWGWVDLSNGGNNGWGNSGSANSGW
jgi:hypothetical protein